MVDGRSDRVRKVVRGGECLVLVRMHDGSKSQNLELNGKETGEANEEARESRRVENVTEEPLDVNVLRRGKTKESGDPVGYFHEKRMSGDPVEGEEVVVRQLDAGSGMSDGIVIDGGICVPGLASVLEVVLKTPPFVPLKNAVCQDEDENDDADDDDADLGHLDKVTAEIVDHRSVNLIAESDCGPLGNREEGLVERNAVEGVVDFLLG